MPPRLLTLVGCVLLPSVALAQQPASMELKDAAHRLTITKLPEKAKSADIWFWLPNDDTSFQRVTNLGILKTPPGSKVAVLGPPTSRYLHVHVNLTARPADMVVETQFSLVRHEQLPLINLSNRYPAGVKFDANYEAVFAEHLSQDARTAKVLPDVQRLADKLCGQETDIRAQLALLYTHVATQTKHYKNPTLIKPIPSSVDDALNGFLITPTAGNAEHCLTNGGGGCTDQHSLLIALCRARKIPARIVFGSRVTGPVGQEFMPGYRCWVECFVPGSGWLPMDASQGGNDPKDIAKYYTGMDANRIKFFEGRDVRLQYADGTQTPVIPLFIGAYVLVDNKIHSDWKRTLTRK